MAVSPSFDARLCYWLRLTAIVTAALRHAFTLLRQADRNERILTRALQSIGRKRTTLASACYGLITVPLRHYFAILSESPRIAGVSTRDYQQRVFETHAQVRLLSDELPERSFLHTPMARKLQSDLVQDVFEELFSIRITTDQIFSFSYYAESSELVLDFLDFCHLNHRYCGKTELLAALPAFEQLLFPYRFNAPNDAKNGPQRGELCRKSQTLRVRVRGSGHWFRPGQTLIDLYWNSTESTAILGRANLSLSSRERFAKYFTTCAEQCSPTLLGLLAYEMNKQACMDLLPLAIQLDQPLPDWSSESPKETDFLAQCLMTLEESLRQATGQKTKKRLAASVVRVR